MNRVVTIAAWIAFGIAAPLLASAQGQSTQTTDQQKTQQRDRVRTPGSEPSGTPKKDQTQDKDKIQKRDRIHQPGTGQAGSGKKSRGKQSGSGRGGR